MAALPPTHIHTHTLVHTHWYTHSKALYLGTQKYTNPRSKTPRLLAREGVCVSQWIFTAFVTTILANSHAYNTHTHLHTLTHTHLCTLASSVGTWQYVRPSLSDDRFGELDLRSSESLEDKLHLMRAHQRD